MNLLDTGGYSCVFYPPLKCTNKEVHSDYISKLQYKKDTDYELSIIESIKKDILPILPDYKNYFVLDAYSCTPEPIPKKMTKKCHLFKKKKEDQTMTTLNMPYMGQPLYKLIHKSRFLDYALFKQINSKIIDLYINAISVINKHKIYHHDIKSSNILVGKDGHYRLIDWGISNIMVYKPYFIFNQPYMYLCMNDDFQEKIKSINIENENIVRTFMFNYLNSIDLLDSSDYIYTHEILNIIQPSTDKLHPLLLDNYVRIVMENKSLSELSKIYVNNLDYVGVITIYMDIIYKIKTQKTQHPTLQKLNQQLFSIYLKYIMSGLYFIKSNEFVSDLEQLNIL